MNNAIEQLRGTVLKTALLALLMFGLTCHAAVDTSSELARIEQQLYARTYDTESSQERLDRLENTVFGAPKKEQPVDSRLQALTQFFEPEKQPATASGSAAPGVQNKQPRPDIMELGSPPPEAEKEPDGTRYPAVVAMEQRVFRQTFENEPIENRLGRLEHRVMGRPQPGTLQERTDQLRMIVLGDMGAGPAPMPQGNLANAPSPGDQGVGATADDIAQALGPVEKRVLRRTYPQDTIESRLNRLEMKLFSSTASELSPEDRLYRIAGVVNAQSDSRRENAYRNGPGYGVGMSTRGGATAGGGMGGALGSMLLMILMSLL